MLYVFRRLQWRMTCSYILVTLPAIMFIQLCLLVLVGGVFFIYHISQTAITHMAPPLSVAAIRAKAQRRAATLGAVPRTELVLQFQAIAEEVRQQAIAQNTAIEGNWERD